MNINISKSKRSIDMNKIRRKIISGAIFVSCAFIGISGIALVNSRLSDDAIPASLISDGNEKPTVIIDAGIANQLKLVHI